jgi:anti-sigma-K factor RskA
MASLVQPIVPSPGLWERIARNLAAPGPARATRAEKRTGFWDSLNFWRFASATGFAAAILLAFVAFLRPAPEVIPIYTAVLQSPADKTAGWLVEGTGLRRGHFDSAHQDQRGSQQVVAVLDQA